MTYFSIHHYHLHWNFFIDFLLVSLPNKKLKLLSQDIFNNIHVIWIKKLYYALNIHHGSSKMYIIMNLPFHIQQGFDNLGHISLESYACHAWRYGDSQEHYYCNTKKKRLHFYWSWGKWMLWWCVGLVCVNGWATSP